MPGWIQRQRSFLDDDLARRGLVHTFSLARFTLHRATQELIDAHAAGVCLDVGSGRAPYRDLLASRCERVVTLDIERRTEDVDLIGDIQNLEGIAEESYDTVVCTQVLEHLPRPWDALGEIRRVLRPGGKLILSVPHLPAIHEAPHDYYRYTRYGLASLCEGAALESLEIREAGGLLSFVGHGASYALMSTLGTVPGVRHVVWAINYLLLCRLLGLVDSLLGMRSVYPCNLALVAWRVDGQ